MGAKGAGEPPMISSVAAVVAAIRAATGLELHRAPVRPQDIALGRAAAALPNLNPPRNDPEVSQ